ncbi:MAG: hypothetical protein AB1805_15335 [Nitrospirota bacterium]
MAFNPLQEKGIPLEKQIRGWAELNVQPYNKNEVHPYTRTRGILMNGIEVEAALCSHECARHIADLDLKRNLAFIRRLEQQQQKAVNWMIPGDESTLEVTIGYEQLAVDLTAYLARTVPDPYFKQVLDFALIEDFDHLYRYANLMEMSEGKKAETLVGDYTEIMPGRPTIKEHRHPYDEIRNFVDRTAGPPLNQLYALTITAAEQQTMNYYMNVGNRLTDSLGRGIYLEIGQIEEQHVSHYESMIDPRMSMYEMMVMHEYNECYLYYSCLQTETDPRVKSVWEMHLNMEIEHLKYACDLMRKYDKKDPEAILPREMPAPIVLESNIDYVRDIIATQTDLTALETGFIRSSELEPNARYFKYQKDVNTDGVPTELVIEQNRVKSGREYRHEVKGPHPLEEFRMPAMAAR